MKQTIYAILEILTSLSIIGIFAIIYIMMASASTN